MDDGRFMCMNCYAAFDPDQISIVDLDEAEKYKQEFEGAKIAGMLSEPEFEGDKDVHKATL